MRKRIEARLKRGLYGQELEQQHRPHEADAQVDGDMRPELYLLLDVEIAYEACSALRHVRFFLLGHATPFGAFFIKIPLVPYGMQGRWLAYVEFRRNGQLVPDTIREIAGQCNVAVPAYGEPVDGHPGLYQFAVPNLAKKNAMQLVERCRREAGYYISVALIEPQES